jgi:hypothetical protein
MALPGDVGLRAAALAALFCLGSIASGQQALAQSNDCGREAASIRKAETQLPRLEVAPPADQQIVCITLETNMLFAKRLGAHVAQCPRSPYAQKAGDWQRTAEQYAAQFNERRCEPAIKSFRG